ncbi:hypothetical protein BASA62_002127 [Batrachochytrium salamandrivorans]|nr:hypothetical protein BASA62_002127 [Batrachochytrium salamandrivorans]
MSKEQITRYLLQSLTRRDKDQTDQGHSTPRMYDQRYPQTTEHAFLTPIKSMSDGHFYLQTEFSRSLFKKISNEAEDTDSTSTTLTDLDAHMQKVFRVPFSNTTDLLCKDRIQCLDRCLERVIQICRPYADLLSQIQNEYHLVIKSVLNINDEKAFLRTKINRLLVEYATTNALESEKVRIVGLVAAWDFAESHRHRIQVQSEKEELSFIEMVGNLFPLEVEKSQSEKSKKDILYLGRWSFVKSWIEQRASSDTLLKDLFEKLEKNPTYYKRIFPDDDNLAIHEYDTPEICKLKNLVEEQRRLIRNYTKELASADKKEKSLNLQISEIDIRIGEITEVLNTKFGPHRSLDI